MTQRQLEREVAAATGESINLIHRTGFSLVDPDDPAPLVMDWDELDSQRLSIFPVFPARPNAA